MIEILSFFGGTALGLSFLVSSHFLPWVSWHSEVAAFFAVFLLGWCGWAGMLRTPDQRRVTLPFMVVLFTAVALLALLQRVFGLSPFWGDVWVLWFYIALCIVCLALGYAAASASTQNRPLGDVVTPFTSLAFVLVAGALGSIVIEFAQVFSLWGGSDWIVRMPGVRRPGGNLAQPNHLATLLVMAVASVIFLRQSKKLSALASGLLLFTLCVGLAATESRAGALSLLVLLGWWQLKRKAIGDTTPKWIGVVAGVAFAAMFIAWPYLLNAMHLLAHEAGGRISEGSPRFHIWPQLVQAVGMRPWAGWGFHQVAAAHNAVTDAYLISEPYGYSHNLLLDLAVWFGIPVALLLIGLVGLWLWRRARDANSLLPWYGLAVALPLGLHSMLEYPFAYAYFLAPVMFMLGAVEARLGHKLVVRVDIKLAGALLIITTTVMAWSVIEYVQIEEDFRIARYEEQRVGSTPAGYRRPKIVLFDQLGALLEATRITPARNMSPEAIAVVKRVALQYPWTDTQYRYAVSLALNGNPVEAARQFQVMRRIWGEKRYNKMKIQLAELAIEYPELHQVSLP